MFCDLNGATSIPRLRATRHSPVTNRLLPASDDVPAISKPVVRAAMRSVYAPARFDGAPGTSVGVVVFNFGVRYASETPVPERPAPARRL